MPCTRYSVMDKNTIGLSELSTQILMRSYRGGKWYVVGKYTIKNEKRKKTTLDFYACVSGTRDNPVIEEFETR